MAVTNPSALALAEPERHVLDAWLAAFVQGWHEGALAVRVQSLPALADALRFPALVEMVKLDLRRQWQQGRRPSLESYLESYPQLGTPYTVPADLIQAEYEARQQAGEAADLAEFARRFPGRIDELRRLIGQAQETTSFAVEEQGQATPPPAAADRSARVRPDADEREAMNPPAAGGLPEQFGRYRIIRKLGKGGMGTVYLAHDTQFDRPVALKVPHFGPDDGPEVVERFYREARAAAVMHHPNFCPVYDVGAIDGTPYLTMAYLEGRSLAEVVRDGPLPPDRAAALTRTLAAALDAAHRRGVIHRDLKPSNVLLTESGEPVVLDFGLARRTGRGDVRLTQTGAVVGTPAYVAPEQLAGKGEPTPACDIYSLGALFYELLTGRPPFVGPLDVVLAQALLEEPAPPSSLRPEVSPALDAACRRALAKKPEDRFVSMAAFAAALAPEETGAQATSAALVVERESTLSLPAPPPLPSWRRRWRRWLWASAAALLLAVGLLWYFNTNYGTAQVKVDTSGAEILVDGARQDNPADIRLPVGEHTLVVKFHGVAMATKTFTIHRGKREVLQVDIADQIAKDPALEAFRRFSGLTEGIFGTIGRAANEQHEGFEKGMKNPPFDFEKAIKDLPKIPD
jgi:serine/threonine protein kinase